MSEERAREWLAAEVARFDSLINGMDEVARNSYIAASGPHKALAALDALAEERRVGRLLAEALARAAYVSEHLHAMVPREVWRDSGGDDGQGHYEGDYRAEQLLAEIHGWEAALAESGALDQETGEA